MKRFKRIDYSQRPASYSQRSDGLAGMLINIKGAQRRMMIADYWRQGRIKELDKALLKPELSKREREALGKVHPTFLGGEYLPRYRDNEIEIARIELASVTADVISIRARPNGHGISFRIVDEYGTRFRLARNSSRESLTLTGLVRLIEESENPELGHNLALCYNELNAQDGCRKHWQDFTTVSSDFYPQLRTHFQRIFKHWAQERP